MKKINCNIIKDILPLYVDDVISEDTKEMVEKHLEFCEGCEKEIESMKREIYIPVKNEVSIIKNFKRKWRNKKLIISGLSIAITCLTLFGMFYFVFYYDKLIPYTESLVKIETQDDNTLVSHYYGEDYESVSGTHPISMEIDGEQKNVIFVYYTETIASSYLSKQIDSKQLRNESENFFPLANTKDVDQIYYVEFDSMKIFEEGNDWSEVLKNAKLIWEK